MNMALEFYNTEIYKYGLVNEGNQFYKFHFLEYIIRFSFSLFILLYVSLLIHISYDLYIWTEI